MKMTNMNMALKIVLLFSLYACIYSKQQQVSHPTTSNHHHHHHHAPNATHANKKSFLRRNVHSNPSQSNQQQQQHEQQLQNYRALVEKNNQLAKSIYQNQQAINQNKAVIIRQTERLKRLKLERQQQLVKLQSAIKSKQSAVLALERDSKAMKKLLSTTKLKVLQRH